MRILLTGAAGFIGSRTAQQLLAQGKEVIGMDNLNGYYDVRLKRYRLKELSRLKRFSFLKGDIENASLLKRAFDVHRPQAVINLAARAGVRYSLVDPHVYMRTNALGTLNLLELCRSFRVKKFVLASTSSLYAGQRMPFKETLPVNEPISPYAASKKSAEALCYTYHYLYGLDTTVFRYFTVYGPAGRPDMSPFRFIEWVLRGKPIRIFGDGSQKRDFTYVDDIAAGTIQGLNIRGHQVVNLGGNHPYTLRQMIRVVERHAGRKARLVFSKAQKEDMTATWADVSKARRLTGWKPETGLEEGLGETVKWHRANRWLSLLDLGA